MASVVSMGVRESVCRHCAGRLYAPVAYCPFCSEPQCRGRRERPIVVALVPGNRREAAPGPADEPPARPVGPLSQPAGVAPPPATAVEATPQTTTSETTAASVATPREHAEPTEDTTVSATGSKPFFSQPLVIAAAICCLAAVGAAVYLLAHEPERTATEPRPAPAVQPAVPPAPSPAPTGEPALPPAPPLAPPSSGDAAQPPVQSPEELNTSGRGGPVAVPDPSPPPGTPSSEEQRDENLRRWFEQNLNSRSGEGAGGANR